MNALAEIISFDVVRNALALVSLIAGLFFMFVGALGVNRFPDVYSRLHAASKCTTLGFAGMLLAACFHLADPRTIALAATTIVFTFVASPIGSHLLAKAAHHGKAKTWRGTVGDELADDKADPQAAVSDEIIGVPDSDEMADIVARFETDHADVVAAKASQKLKEAHSHSHSAMR